jgi:hypothetical protein
MNDAERLEAMDSYFGRYRKLTSRLKENEQENDIARKAYDQRRTELQEERHRISRDLANMRQVITKMIDDGIDPVMAGLIMDEEDATSSTIWQQRDEDGFGMHQDDIMNRMGKISALTTADISTLSMGQLSWPGATGATGAIGAQRSITSMGPNGGYQQGYGAIPPINNHPGVTADMRGFVDGHGDYHSYAWTGTAEL